MEFTVYLLVYLQRQSDGYFDGILSFLYKGLLRRYTPEQSGAVANDSNLARKEEDVGGTKKQKNGNRIEEGE